MSDSEDFGGFDPTTPDVTRANAKPGASRPQAGPSRAAAGSKHAKKATGRAPEQSDVEELEIKKPKAARVRKPQAEILQVEEEVVDKGGNRGGDDDEIEEIDALPRKSIAASKKPSSRTNGAGAAGKPDSKSNPVIIANAAAKGKAKAKLKPSVKASSTKVVQVAEDVMDIDDADEDIIEDVEEEVPPPRPIAKTRPVVSGPHSGKPLHKPRRDESQEVARLNEQLTQARGFIEDLKKQLNEIYTVRHTEPEQLMERMEAQHSIQMQVHDGLVKDLTEKLAKHDPNFRTGKNSVFELLTRDEADKETQSMQNELEKYKKLVNDRDKALKAKDAEIESLMDDQRSLKIELQAEIERAKTLVDKSHRQPHGSVTRNLNSNIISSHNDPKQTEIVKFYEDLSNVLVPSMKSVPGRYPVPDTDEWQLNCCYTYTDVTEPGVQPKSLSFNLKLCWDARPDVEEPIESKDQLIEMIHYFPKDLDKESEDFNEALGFLAKNFTFERTQLSLFMRTMHDYVSGENVTKESDESDDSGMVVEE